MAQPCVMQLGVPVLNSSNQYKAVKGKRWLPMSWFIIAALVCNLNALADTRIVVRPAQSDADVSHDYFVQLLHMVFDATSDEYGEVEVSFLPVSITQKREIELLKENVDIDIGWFGETQTRKNELGVVNIPLLRGTLGYRMMAIHRDNKPLFDRIKRADELKKLLACQGSSWPDSDILEYNGYAVNRIAKFKSMYKMLSLKRCDYFPRAVAEGYGEVDRLNNKDIIAYDRLLLVYPFYMKFFTHKNNEELIKRLQKGLLISIATGRLENLLRNHAATKSMFPLNKFEKSVIFTLDNPESDFRVLKDEKSKVADLLSTSHSE